MGKNAIENAEVIIEAFGGIRPMAKKMGVAVTTVQGWKKRNVIPGTRIEQLLAAAAEHDIDLVAIGVSSNFDVDVKKPAAKVDEPVKPVEVVQEVCEIAEPDAEDEGDVLPEEVTVSDASPIVAAKAGIKPSDKTSEEKIVESMRPVPKASNTLVIMLVLSALIALGFVAVAAYFWQKAEADKAEAQRLFVLEQKLSEVQNEVDGVKDSQGFLGNIIPKDLNEQIASLKEQAQDIQGNLDTTLKQVQETSRAVSDDVLAKDAGNLEQRLTNLETHLQDITGSPVLAGMLARVEELQTTDGGSDVLARTVSELDALLGSVQGGAGQLGEGADAAINSTLNRARQQSNALGETFDAVPQDELKAAAMLLGMAQLRSSLNRDNEAFESDLALLQKLVGEDNPELSEALVRLAPHAQNGVLTPSGLSTELRSFAGDAVAASLQGEDVTLEERAKARINNLLQVEKDGELVSGTETQASIAKADQLLQQGDIAGAISSVESLDGGAAQALTPWLEQAKISLDAQKAKGVVSDVIDGSVLGAGGHLVQDAESGINIYVPNNGPVNNYR